MNGTRIWDSWCRLCAKENGNQVNVLVKSEETCGTDLSQIIQKYFNVEITSYEYAPNSICFQCDKFVSDLVTFSERTKKVQNLFTELEYIDKDPFNGNISALRDKYGVNHEKNLYDDLEGFLEEHIQAENKKRKRRGRKPTSVVADEEEQVMELEQVEAIGEDCLEVKIIKDESNEIFNISPKDQESYTKTEQDPTVSVPEDEFDDNDDVNDSDYDDADYSENENDEKYSLDEDALIKEEFLENPSKPMKFNCDSCDKSYNKETLLRRHMNQHHDVPCDLKFSCTICDKSFTKDTHRRRHEKTVHKTGDQTETVYPCPFCDKKFQKAPNVKTHIKVVHSTEKPYICEECGKAFKTIGALKEHKYTHTEECPFQCSSCDKRFKNRARLKTHEDTHKDTTYVCTICGLQLNTRRTLKMHMLVHSDQKKHKCNYCGNEFKRAKALKNHLILHTGLKPYTCNFCDKTFANGSNCRSHKKKSHPYELAALEASGTKSYCQNMPKLEHLKAAAQSQPNSTPQTVRKVGKRPEPFPNVTAATPKLEAIPTTISIDSSMTDPHSQSVIIEQQQTPQRFHQTIQIENSNSNQSTTPGAGQQIQLQQQNYSVLASIYQPFQIGS